MRRVCTRMVLRSLSAIALVVCFAASAHALQVGVTSAQNKVYFQPPNEFLGSFTDTVLTYLARNEYEATQLVLFPSETVLGARVEVGPLTRSGGTDQIASEQVEVRLIGYVNQTAARFPVDRVGWIPDPLLPDQPVDLVNGVPQPYLITVYAPASTTPGTYLGSFRVKGNGVTLKTLTWIVEVWNFTLPAVPAFKTTSLSIRSDVDGMWPGRITSETQRDTLVRRLADLGFRNRLPPTGALANGLDSWNWPDSGHTRYGYPTHDGTVFNAVRTGAWIDYLLSKGANMFLIGFTFDIYSSCCDTTLRRNNLVKYLRDYRAFLQSRNLLDRAYVYNIDEPWGVEVTHARRIYDLIKSEVGSDLRVMQNANQDNDTIIGTLLNHFDALDVNLGHYDINDVDSYRANFPAQLAELWWNVNIWPDTHPNLLLEYPLVDARIFGPMSYKYKIQGFEYWNIKSQWSVGAYYPIDSNTFRVQWNVNNKSLDGSLVYPGSDFEIYSSLRFESFRDGMEDYEYLKLLEARYPGHPLLNVDVVTDLSTFSRNPFELENFHRQIGNVLGGLATDVTEPRAVLPEGIDLLGNHPNPFNGGTAIEFELPEPAQVQVEVFDILGRFWATPHSGRLTAGRHRVVWNGDSDQGLNAPSGVYLYRLSTEHVAETGKMLLLR
jgi:hypothetical protein